MEIFINETSLDNQFQERHHFFASLKIFVSSIARINEIKNDKSIYKSDNFYYYTGILGSSFEGMLKTNPSLGWTFRANLDKLNPKSWQKQKVHEDHSSYDVKGEDFVSTSVAELAERKHQNQQLIGFLLNFIDSKFGNELRIDVLKNNKDQIGIDCITTPESIDNWLILNGFVEYDVNSGIAPADYQTVLKDSKVFEKTNYPKNQGRAVYRKINTNELWVVDNSAMHAGENAHCEIFDEKNKKHLGTSLYNEINLNTEFKKNDREINLG